MATTSARQLGARPRHSRAAPPAAARASASAPRSSRGGDAGPRLALPWDLDVRADAVMTPRYMDAQGPADPMALLMRQRIVFLGTEARAGGRGRPLPVQAPHSAKPSPYPPHTHGRR